MLTTRGLGLVAAAVVAWGVGRLLGIPELYVVAVACAAVVGLGFVLVRIGTGSLAVRRRLTSERLLNGTSTTAVLEVRTTSRIPAAVLLVEDARPAALRDDDGASPVRFVVPGLRPGRVAPLHDTIVGRNRGRHPVGPATIKVRDPFGAVERSRRFRGTDEVIVYPVVEALDATGPVGLLAGVGSSTNRHLLTQGDEFHAMREYARGDDLRRVHWATTARRGKLMVRQDDQPWEARATIICDTRIAEHGGLRSASTIERAISAAASIVWHLADRGYVITLVTETDRGATGPAPWSAHLDRLAVIEPTRSTPLGPALGAVRGDTAGGLLVAILAPPEHSEGPIGRHPEVRALRRAAHGFTNRVALVCEPPGPAGARAQELASALGGGGWKAATLRTGQPLAPLWPELSRSRRGRTPAATPVTP